jgi:hypothetical protein
MRTYPKALHLTMLATLVILLGLLVGGPIGYLASNDRGLSPFTSAAVTTSVCPGPGEHPEAPVTTGEPLPFDCGIGEAAGEHNLP